MNTFIILLYCHILGQQKISYNLYTMHNLVKTTEHLNNTHICVYPTLIIAIGNNPVSQMYDIVYIVYEPIQSQLNLTV